MFPSSSLGSETFLFLPFGLGFAIVDFVGFSFELLSISFTVNSLTCSLFTISLDDLIGVDERDETVEWFLLPCLSSRGD